MSGGMEDWREEETGKWVALGMDALQKEMIQKELDAYRASLKPPKHYGGDWEIGEFIYNQGLDFYQGNAVKYICRYEKKGGKEDLQKAISYLEKLIELKYGEKKT